MNKKLTILAVMALVVGLMVPTSANAVEMGDTNNPEIDITLVEVDNDGTDFSCMLFIATANANGLLNKSTFRCHIDFDDLESEAAVGRGQSGCDANNDGDTSDTFRLGSNHTENGGIGPYCTTSDITLTYRVSRRGGSCTGLPSVSCSEQEFDEGAEVAGDTDCNGEDTSSNPLTDASCKITITASLADLDAAWESECRTDDDCLTSATDKDTNDEYDVFMFFDSQRKSDRDRVPNTSPDTTKPDDASEVVTKMFPVPAP